MTAGVIKSAERTLLVLELFAIWRRPATVSEVEAALDMPQSSTSVLLRSLVTLGYLEYDPARRTYCPTLRVAMLGDWLQPGVAQNLHADRLDRLRDLTGETVLLGRRQGNELHYLQISRSGQELQYFVREGTRRPLCTSASGRAILSSFSQQALTRVLRVNNTGAGQEKNQIDAAVFGDAIAHVRQTGVSETDLRFDLDRGIHAIAVLMPGPNAEEPYSLCLAGPSERVLRKRAELIGHLHAWVSTAPAA